MKKQKTKKKTANLCNDGKQLSLLTFFRSKPKSTESRTLENSPVVCDDNDGVVKSNSTSPDVIEATPQSNTFASGELANRLNFALNNTNEFESPKLCRKKLFEDPSSKIITGGSYEECENDSKQSIDDALPKLLDEENSSTIITCNVRNSSAFTNIGISSLKQSNDDTCSELLDCIRNSTTHISNKKESVVSARNEMCHLKESNGSASNELHSPANSSKDRNISISENNKVCRLKRTSDDVCDELLEEIEVSTPKISGASISALNCIQSSRIKRLKLSSSNKAKKIPEKSSLKPILNSTEISRVPNVLIPIRKEELKKSPSVRKIAESNSVNSIDIENLGDLFKNEFDLCNVGELNLNSWTYCEVTKVEIIQNGVKAHLNEIVSKKCSPLSTICYVKGYWGESMLLEGDLVSVKARYNHPLRGWLIDENEGFLVKYPNLLVTGTSVVGSLFCLRKVVLSYLFPGLDPPNMVMLLGSLVHELFQEILKHKIIKEEEMKSKLTELLSHRRILLNSYECGISLTDLRLELDKFIPRIASFIKMYILNRDSRKMWAGRIEEIISIEENFWVPQLGMKGKTDLIVKAVTVSETKVMPLELKTGRPTNSVEHRGQIILYLMMMTELNMNVDTGLLLYLKDNILHEIIPRRGERNGLVTVRNNLVDYFVKNKKMSLSAEKVFSVPSLPEPINHHTACAKCPYLIVCSAALSKEVDVELRRNNPLKELSVSSIQHLSPSHIEYVFHWFGLLKLEENGKNDRFANVSDIWLVDPEKRQERGNCIPWLHISHIEVTDDNYFLHHLMRSEDNFDFTSSGIVDGDYIVISSSNRFAVATGFVHNISKNLIILKVDRPLEKQMKGGYIVDRYGGTEGFLGFNSSNLLLLLEDTDAAATLRKLIIDLELPSFHLACQKLPSDCNLILNSLNSYQQESILKVLSAKNFTLVKGLPGTGKTATIIALIKILVRLNYTVLITSHTHSAVDNVLMRLQGSVDFIRLGSSNKVNSAINSYCENSLLADLSMKSTEDIEKFFNAKQVVGVTCMGCSHILLNKRKFDFCIIDEATQVLQPSVIRALYSARKFVLIGDPDQLPPVVHNFSASRLGLSESLFHRLDRHEVTTTLHSQYRMNSKIMQLANAFAYQDKLKCDCEIVNSATIKFKCPLTLIDRYSWLKLILSSDISHSLIFLNIQRWTMDGSNSFYCNQLEIDITAILVNALKQNFEESYDIGIIAPYREQVLLLKKYFSHHDSDVEINTVDQFQGRDKDVIIFSSTRWSNQKEEGILGDERRLTVAITRAKRKLIIVGSAPILRECSAFNKLLDCISTENIVDINKL